VDEKQFVVAGIETGTEILLPPPYRPGSTTPTVNCALTFNVKSARTRPIKVGNNFLIFRWR
jgi:hypothetical protein